MIPWQPTVQTTLMLTYNTHCLNQTDLQVTLLQTTANTAVLQLMLTTKQVTQFLQTPLHLTVGESAVCEITNDDDVTATYTKEDCHQ